MTQPASGFLNPDPQIVDGIDIDVVVAAVRSCPGVDDLDGGQLGSVASYLPGRSVPGVRIGAEKVTVQVRTRWAVPLDAVGTQLRSALIPLIGGRRLDIVVSDITEPSSAPRALSDATSDEGPSPWTNTNGDGVKNSSGRTTPTVAVTPTSSLPASPPSTISDS